LGSILSVVSHHLAHRCVKIGGGFREVLSKYECGLVVGPLNKVKGDFGQQSLRPNGKFASGIILGKSLGK